MNEEKGKIIFQTVNSYYDVITSTKKLPNKQDIELIEDSVLASYILQANVYNIITFQYIFFFIFLYHFQSMYYLFKSSFTHHFILLLIITII